MIKHNVQFYINCSTLQDNDGKNTTILLLPQKYLENLNYTVLRQTYLIKIACMLKAHLDPTRRFNHDFIILPELWLNLLKLNFLLESHAISKNLIT